VTAGRATGSCDRDAVPEASTGSISSLHERGSWPRVGEELTVHGGGLPPPSDVGQHDAGADHMLRSSSDGLERLEGDRETSAGLCRKIANSHCGSIRSDRRGARHAHEITDPDGPGESDLQLERGP
jgi:hypothetical protein